MNTRAAGRGTTTAGIAATTDALTTVAAAGERGRQGTTRGVIYQPGYTLTKSATFPENRTTSVSRSLTGSSTVPFHRGGRCFVRLLLSRSLTGSSTVPVHREGGSRQRMSGPSTMLRDPLLHESDRRFQNPAPATDSPEGSRLLEPVAPSRCGPDVAGRIMFNPPILRPSPRQLTASGLPGRAP